MKFTEPLGAAEDLAKLPPLLIVFGKRPTASTPPSTPTPQPQPQQSPTDSGE